ncbi:ABC transporter permease [Ectobacillus ponti]|uniref:ABC transporter permease n=1 Tax=Ectobacillus ponti TaxID=2961894 RepID=A0AA42BV74_9BACI|nr:ABC transporter permease [Ectobacillus ponti]MCP8971323.1 ABC transporter permease [Ectobacillus ponti]
MESVQLWEARLQQYLQKTFRYLARIGSGLLYAFLCCFGIIGYYYAQLIRANPPQWIMAAIIIIVLAAVLTRIRVRTLLQEPDLVFLLPLESRMKPYLQRALFLGSLLQCLRCTAAAAILAPLCLYLSPDAPLLVQLLLLLLLQLGNVQLSWAVSYYQEKGWSTIVRFCLNAAFVYFLLREAYGYAAVLLVITGCLLVYIRQRKPALVPWEYFIGQEKHMDMSFYRFVNLFTDVPQVMRTVKPRRFLSFVIKPLLERKRQSFLYLYGLAFLRANDYLGLYVRLTAVGLLLMIYVPGLYGKGIVLLLCLYASGLQLQQLRKHFYNQIAVDLYPLTEEARKHAFVVLFTILLLLQHTIFTIGLAAVMEGWLLWAVAGLLLLARQVQKYHS